MDKEKSIFYLLIKTQAESTMKLKLILSLFLLNFSQCSSVKIADAVKSERIKIPVSGTVKQITEKEFSINGESKRFVYETRLFYSKKMQLDSMVFYRPQYKFSDSIVKIGKIQYTYNKERLKIIKEIHFRNGEMASSGIIKYSFNNFTSPFYKAYRGKDHDHTGKYKWIKDKQLCETITYPDTSSKPVKYEYTYNNDLQLIKEIKTYFFNGQQQDTTVWNYNTNGFVSEKTTSYTVHYSYITDSEGNWIYRTSKVNGGLNEETTRVIEYQR